MSTDRFPTLTFRGGPLLARPLQRIVWAAVTPGDPFGGWSSSQLTLSMEPMASG
jgi:hypothetical protein